MAPEMGFSMAVRKVALMGLLSVAKKANDEAVWTALVRLQ